MMINAEYEELDEPEGELDLPGTDSLSWLESDEDDNGIGGFDNRPILLFAAGLLGVLALVVGGVWWASNRTASKEMEADGSTIAAPAGAIKERPSDPGGKTFEGTGNVAPVVGEGGSLPAQVADQAMPPLPGAPGGAASGAAASGAAGKLGAAGAPATTVAGKPATAGAPATAAGKAGAAGSAPAQAQAPAAGGVGVQLAAYRTRARAEDGWNQISRRTSRLKGLQYRVVEARVDIGTVYRLQAVTGSRAEADRLCAGLKADGVDCQVK
jgi:hypothetical protein